MKPVSMTIEITNLPFPRADALAIVGDKEYWRRSAADYGIPKETIDRWTDGGYTGLVVRAVLNDKFEGLIVFLPPCDWSLDWYMHLTHECSHLVDECMYLHELGDSMKVTEEVRARLHEFYYAQIAMALRGVKPCTFKQRHFNYKGKYPSKPKTEEPK